MSIPYSGNTPQGNSSDDFNCPPLQSEVFATPHDDILPPLVPIPLGDRDRHGWFPQQAVLPPGQRPTGTPWHHIPSFSPLNPGSPSGSDYNWVSNQNYQLNPYVVVRWYIFSHSAITFLTAQ
jgi:hypothetical protein